MGDNLPFVALDNKGLVRVSSLSGVGYHTCAITYTGTKAPAAGKLKCWGYNEYFTLGVLSGTYYVGTMPGQMGDCAIHRSGGAPCPPWGGEGPRVLAR